jgi:prepilin-type processing-associated H-X9-DG protein
VRQPASANCSRFRAVPDRSQAPACRLRLRKKPKDHPYLGWAAQLLPYIEQDAVSRKIEIAFKTDPKPLEFYGHAAHAQILRIVVSRLLCPVDTRLQEAHPFETGPVAFSSYLGVSGRNFVRKDGVLFADSRITSADIRDGLSHTILLGERPPSADFRLGWWYRGWGVYQDGTAEMVLGVRERNFAADYPECPGGPYKFAAGSLSNDCDAFHFWSLHLGGANFAFCDGSVRFMSYTIADDVLPALSTRAGGETTTFSD